MSKIFKPRRGRASTMAGTKASTVLAAGEFFVELPDTGVGTGPCKIKMGDGSTTYPNLPYALGDEVSDVTITADSSSSASAALANVVSGKSLGQLIGSLKQACSKNADAIATLNDEYYLFDVDQISACRKFNVVFLHWGYPTLDSDGYTLKTILPERFRPTYRVRQLSKCFNGSTYIECNVDITTEGYISFIDNQSTGIQGIEPVFFQTRPIVYNVD